MIQNRCVDKLIILQEYENVEIPKQDFLFLSTDDFEKVRHSLSPLVNISPSWNPDNYKLSADSKVGAIVTNGIRVEVRPKIAATEFCALIHYVLSGKLPPEHYRSYANLTWETGFEDALCTLLCDEIDEIRRIGLSRRYEERHDALPMVRGRPSWSENFPWRGAKSKEIVCRHHHLTYDNLDNRLLLAGLKSANLLTFHKDVKPRVHKLLKMLIDVASAITPEADQFDKAFQNYNRLNEHYLVAHSLAKMFIFHRRPEDFYQSGKSTVPGIVLNMSSLFEKFVERFAVDLLQRFGISIKPQTGDHRALLDLDGQRYASIRPDIELWKSGRPLGVIDAKYKPYWMAGDNGLNPERKISNEDLYQLFFYQQRVQRKYNLLISPLAIIAAPLPDDDERNGRAIVSNKFRRIFWQAGHEKGGDVKLLLIPMTKYLRLLKEKRAASDAIESLGYDISEMGLL